MKLLVLCLITISTLAYSSEFDFKYESKFVPEFKNRFSFLIGGHPSMTKTSQLMNFHGAYSYNIESNTWWDFNFTMAKGHFNRFTTNNRSATNVTSTTLDENTQSSSQIGFGAGILYETNYIQNLVPFEKMYELISASLTYNYFKDTNVNETFTGPGIIAKLSILKRFSDFVSVGGNMIYNLAVVKRSTENNETSSEASLTLSHFTIGLDLSLYL
jgi:hypothetical protein